MSDSFLRIIPSDPQFVPAQSDSTVAIDFLRSVFPRAGQVTAAVSPSVVLVDCGGNLESIHCPVCGQLLSDAWWQAQMDTAHRDRFSSLEVVMPCCGSRTSLNELRYHWPMGFARYVLQADNPEAQLAPEALLHLQELLGCELRTIQAHY
jgi:hypothetical protein